MNLTEYLLQHKCARPDLRLLEENGKFRFFVCLTCKEEWVISRSREKMRAREENRLDEIRRITEAEAHTTKVFGAHYQGIRRA